MSHTRMPTSTDLFNTGSSNQEKIQAELRSSDLENASQEVIKHNLLSENNTADQIEVDSNNEILKNVDNSSCEINEKNEHVLNDNAALENGKNSSFQNTETDPVPNESNNKNAVNCKNSSCENNNKCIENCALQNVNATIDNITHFGNTLPHIYVKNMVCGLELKCSLNLKLIYSRLRYTDYNPKRFPGCIIKLLEPKITAMAFSSGKVMLLGATSFKKADLGARKFIRIFQKIGYTIEMYTLKTHNVIGVCDILRPINLEALYEIHTQFSRYEPEVFPALIYRLVKPRVVLLIFANGKVVITGAKSVQDLWIAMSNMHSVLCSFRK